MRNYDEDCGQKTLISWIVGLLIGGLLVWVFSGDPSARTPSGSDAQYKICGSDQCYNVESYTKESNCVFMAEVETRVCGDYTITKLNLE